jgi:cobalt-zinc-cadmium efflux system outer membrane protein
MQIQLAKLRTHSCFVFGIALIILGSLQLSNAYGQLVRHLTLQGAIDTGISRDYKLAILGSEVEAGTLAKKQIPLRRLPQLRYNVGASYSPTSPSFGYDPTVSNGGQLNAQIVGSESLYDGGKRAIELRQSELDLSHLSNETGLERADLRLEITQIFIQILHAHESMLLLDSSLLELRKYHDLVEKLFAGGAVGQTDLLAVTSQVQMAEIARERAAADEAASRCVLAASMGSPGDTNFVVDGLLESLMQAGVPQPIDSTTNLEFRTKDLEAKKAELDIDLARAQKKPTLDLEGDAGILTSILNLQQPSGSRSSILGLSVGVVLDGPLLDWGANDLLVDQRRSEFESKQIEKMQLARSLNSELVRLSNELTVSQRRIAPLKEALGIAEQNYSLTLAKYAGGGARAIEVLDAHRQVMEMRASLVDLQAEIDTERASLERLNTQ